MQSGRDELAYGWRARFSQEAAAGERLEIGLASAWGAATLGVFAPDGSVLAAPEVGTTSLIVEKAVAGDYVIHVAGGAGIPVPYTLNVLRKGVPAAPPAPTPSGGNGLPPVPDPGDKVVYLTFDDGPDSRYTPKILEALRKYDARATFFVIGTNLQRNRSIAEKIVAQGSTIANHTWNHESLKGVSRDQFHERRRPDSGGDGLPRDEMPPSPVRRDRRKHHDVRPGHWPHGLELVNRHGRLPQAQPRHDRRTCRRRPGRLRRPHA